MSEQEKQEGQKTIVAFVAGLLIGGLLVWVFSGTPNTDETPNDEDRNPSMMTENEGDDSDEETESTGSTTATEESPVVELVTGEGKVELSTQNAGNVVTFENVTYPLEDGWIAVRSYTDETLGSILGASRFSKSQGLVPEAVQLLAPTVAGREYAIVFFTENGDRAFNLATDVQVEGVFATFTAK